MSILLQMQGLELWEAGLCMAIEIIPRLMPLYPTCRRLGMGKEVTDAAESCSIEDVLARLTVRSRALQIGSTPGSVMLSSGSLQKSEDVVGDMGGDSIVSRLLREDPLLWGALQRHKTLLSPCCSSMRG